MDLSQFTSVVELRAYLIQSVIPRLNGDATHIGALWKGLAPSQSMPNAPHTLPVAQLINALKQYKVVHFLDVRMPIRLYYIQVLVNFIYWGQFELRPIPGKGRGLVCLRDMTVEEFNALDIVYGGRWMTCGPIEDTPLSLESMYVLEATPDVSEMQGMAIDGERYFRLGELGRWINTDLETPQRTVNVEYRMYEDQPMRMYIKATRDLQKDKELIVQYTMDPEQQARWKQRFVELQAFEKEPMIKIDKDTGLAMAKKVILPNTVLTLYN